MSCGNMSATFRIYFLIILCVLNRGSTATAADSLLLGDIKGNEVMKTSQQHNMDDNDIRAAHDNSLRLHSMDGMGKDDHVHGHGQMSHMGHMDPSLNVFLMEKDLKVGNTMPIYFPNRNPSSSPHFLPKEEADSIPFSLNKLPYLLHLFSFSNGSPQAKAMSDTLRQCELAPIEGETKLCATSLESMIEFTQSIFGTNTHFRVLTTKHARKPSSATSQAQSLLHNYTILNISREISVTKMVPCHTMPYPYTVFYCHYQVSKSKVFKVSLIGELGEGVEAIVVCHMDTSAWDPDHVSFQMLGIKPGTDPVCHFFPEDNLVWVS